MSPCGVSRGSDPCPNGRGATYTACPGARAAHSAMDKMDNKNRKDNPETKLKRFAWMREATSEVAKLIAEKRTQWGDAHVNKCGRRGWSTSRDGSLRGKRLWLWARLGMSR